jgi:hypothetical protein
LQAVHDKWNWPAMRSRRPTGPLKPVNPGLTSGLPGVVQGLWASVPRSYRSISLESAPDRSYDVQPADERKGKATEGDRYLGKPIITHRLTFTRYPASTRAAQRQKNVAGMNKYWRRPPRFVPGGPIRFERPAALRQPPAQPRTGGRTATRPIRTEDAGGETSVARLGIGNCLGFSSSPLSA